MKPVPITDPWARGYFVALGVIVAFLGLIRLRRLVRLHILLPAKIKRDYWTRPDPDLEIIDPATLPEHLLGPFAHAAAQLASLKFVAVLHYRKPHEHQATRFGIESIYPLWVRQSDCVMAQLAIMRAVDQKTAAPHDVAITAFITELADKRGIQTNNNVRPPATTLLPTDDALCCPGLMDLSRLLTVHLARVRQLSHGSPLVLPAPGAEAEFIRRASREQWDHQIALGTHWLDPEGKLRLTWRGVRAMLRCFSPFGKMLFFKGEAKRLKKLLEETHLGSPEDFSGDLETRRSLYR
jgi:hypothetical protein